MVVERILHNSFDGFDLYDSDFQLLNSGILIPQAPTL